MQHVYINRSRKSYIVHSGYQYFQIRVHCPSISADDILTFSTLTILDFEKQILTKFISSDLLHFYRVSLNRLITFIRLPIK